TGAGAADGFAPRNDVVAYLEGYARRHDLPVSQGVSVTAVERGRNGLGFVVRSSGMDAVPTRAVVVAAGGQRLAKVPPFAARVPAHVTQLHSTDYRNPAALPPGAVLVVGSGQSGAQIAEDLLDAGR